jgi:hypothetical protein
MAMARRYTPQVARRWGYLMNMPSTASGRCSTSSPLGPGLTQALRALVALEGSFGAGGWRESLGGAWVFSGTRVPVRALFENFESGARVDEFPGVTREQVDAVLQHAELSLVEA